MKKQSIKRLLACGLVLTAVLTGCGKKSSGGKAEVKDALPKDDVTIKFAWWGADNRHEAMKKVVDLYEKKNPNVKVEVQYGAWDGWQAKTLTQLSGKTEADVMQINYNWIWSFGKGKNVFYDLNKVKKYLDLGNWDEKYLKAMQIDGQQAAVPHGMTARVPLMNEALYKANNLEFPKTYKEIEEAGKVIGKNNSATGANNQYAFENMGKVSKDLFIAQMLFNETGKIMQTEGKVNYTPEQVQKVFEQWKAFEDSNAMPKYTQDPSVETNANPEWINGKIGGIYEWSNSMAQWVKSYKDGKGEADLKAAPYFQKDADSKPNIYVKPNFGYAISRNTKNPEVAADFLNFIFTNEDAIKAAGDSLGISSNKVTNEEQVKNNLLTGALKEGYEMMDKYDQTVMDPYFEDENVRNERYTAIEGFRSGKLTIEQAAKEYVEKQQAALDKYYQATK